MEILRKKLYSRWNGLRDRCYNSKSKDYSKYGARGIICEWLSFEEFYNDMSGTYIEGYTLDRKDVNGNYSKENCKWSTITEQNRNKRCTKFIETPWGLITTGEASEKSGIPIHVLKLRQRYKVSADKMFLPVRKYIEQKINTPWGLKTIREASEISGIKLKTLEVRILREGREGNIFRPVAERKAHT